jgi:hypothetical protein
MNIGLTKIEIGSLYVLALSLCPQIAAPQVQDQQAPGAVIQVHVNSVVPADVKSVTPHLMQGGTRSGPASTSRAVGRCVREAITSPNRCGSSNYGDGGGGGDGGGRRGENSYRPSTARPDGTNYELASRFRSSPLRNILLPVRGLGYKAPCPIVPPLLNPY